MDLIDPELKIAIDKKIDDQCIIIGSKNQIIELFVNLILNSINALKKSTKKIKFIKIIGWIENNNVVISFYDNGIGLNEPAPETENSQDKIKNGLHICKIIMENHNGKINIVSKQGEWTEFKLFFPSAQKNNG